MSTNFRFNPDLPFVKPGYAGNRVEDGRFVNEDGSMPVGFGTVMKWMLSKNPQREEKRSDRFRLPVKRDDKIFSITADSFSWLGHAAFLFRLGGKLLLIDPCLHDIPLTKRLANSPFKPAELRGLDYILLTHTHRDHFDIPSLKELIAVNPGVQFFVPLNAGVLLKKLGAKNITEAGWFQEFPVAGSQLRIVFLPARHWNKRGLTDTNRELWGSFMLSSGNTNHYFAGDTAPAKHFAEIKQLFPVIDHAFMPVGAYKPEYMMRYAHMSPQEAVDAFHTLGAKTFVPMHFGTFDLSDEPPGEPLRILRRLEQDGQLRGKLLSPALGETMLMNPHSTQ
jgi:L-ascorbate metabolism protein UlaG (beta-lactamase superfamily)